MNNSNFIKFQSYLRGFKNEKSLASAVINGLVWTTFGNIILRFSTFLSSVLIARILGAEDFGEVGIVRSTINMFLAFASFGLGVTSTRFISKNLKDNKKLVGSVVTITLGISIAFGILFCVTLIFLSDWLVENTINAPHLKNELIIGGFAILFNSINGCQNGIFNGFESFKINARTNLISAIFYLPITVLFAYYYNVTGVIYALAIYSFISVIISSYYLRNILRDNNIEILIPKISEVREILLFSLPVVLASIIVMPVNWICNAVLVNSKNGFEQLGLFTAALDFSIIAATINSMFSQALLPFSVKMFGIENKKFEIFNFYFPFIIGIIICQPFIIFPEIATIIYGNKFDNDMLKYSVILVMLGTLANASKQGIARNFIAGGIMWWSLLSNLLWGCITIAFVYIFIYLGSVGRSLAFFLGYLINFIIFIPLYTYKELAPSFFFKSKEFISIWTLILVSACINFFEIVFIVRLFILIAFFIITYYLFSKLFNRYLKL